MNALQLKEYPQETIQSISTYVANRLFSNANEPYCRVTINGEDIKFYYCAKSGRIAFRKLHDRRLFPSGSLKIIKPAVFVSAMSKICVQKVVRFVPAPKGRVEDLYHELSFYRDRSLKAAPGLPRLRLCMTYGRAKLAMFVEAFDGDLFEHLESHPDIPEEEKFSIMWQLASGLFALHNHVNTSDEPDPIVHYDIKPENALYRIRYDTSGVPRYTVALTDFGFSFHTRKRVWNEGVQAMNDHKYGTSIVAAPEFFDAGTCDPLKADIWALAHVYYHLLVGAAPCIASRINSSGQEIPRSKQSLINFVEKLDGILLGSPALQAALQLCQRMFHLEATRRPAIREILEEIKRIAEQYAYSNVGKTTI